MAPEIKHLILENYPTAKVILLGEIGAAGVYPPPGITRRDKEEFQRKLQQMSVDAVVSGNGGCGLCTPKETGSSIAAEYMGIPAVTIAAPGFVTQVRSTAINNGVPAPRVAVYPGAFAAHTREELIENTRRVVWPQIVDALTKPLTQEEFALAPRQEGSDARRRICDHEGRIARELGCADGRARIRIAGDVSAGQLIRRPMKKRFGAQLRSAFGSPSVGADYLPMAA